MFVSAPRANELCNHLDVAVSAAEQLAIVRCLVLVDQIEPLGFVACRVGDSHEFLELIECTTGYATSCDPVLAHDNRHTRFFAGDVGDGSIQTE